EIIISEHRPRKIVSFFGPLTSLLGGGLVFPTLVCSQTSLPIFFSVGVNFFLLFSLAFFS
ncbi:uncharacterized protein F4812DRAFT_408645, partial [Daldinia caldariorum]|uniref:uncharacterized protein n=1 Tax=Daldinia caldariorum TaxID=326644 RepID=UPI002008098A